MVLNKDVRTTLKQHILTDGMDIIVDLKASHGSWLLDQRSGKPYLDFFSMFASMAVGFNHPTLVAAKELLGTVAIQKPANSDMYSETMAQFMTAFASMAIPGYLPHAFFVEGGALAVENGLKAAFDWKVRKNFKNGERQEKGSKIVHFSQAFHGRSGYTLSLTNTADPRKTKYFPQFKWPRISNPKISFPLDHKSLSLVKQREDVAIQELQQAVLENKNDLAGLIIEPIQGEGGDNHFRPQFLRVLRDFCNEEEILLIFDEVQTGVGLTGKFWAHEHSQVQPDILCFGKKTQVCGILASPRIDEVQNNVFMESSRINSTFGGNLVDMARFTLILQVIQQENLIQNAAEMGTLLLTGLQSLERDFSNRVSNARGMGLMCAFDLPETAMRDQFIDEACKNGLLLLGCGTRSIRFRPHLTVSSDEIQEGITILRGILNK